MGGFGYLIVARFMDGELVRGTSIDFRTDRFFFHIWDQKKGATRRVLCDQLKAAFFVKTLDGDPLHVERKTFGREEPRRTKVWARFRDGEELAGWTQEYDVRKRGFLLRPVDPKSNIEMAWIPHAAVVDVRLGAEAERAAETAEARYQPARRHVPPQDWDTLLAIEPADLRRAQAEHARRVSERLRERGQRRWTPRR